MADGHNKEIDALSGVETTGHEWDGLKELNNPLPRWWLYVFYASCVWAFAYWIAYPAWPLVTGYTQGVLGSSQRANAIAAYEAGMAERAETGAALVNASLDEIQQNAQLLEFAMANGQAAFGDNCAPCHGSGATGAVGYPNLQDDKWIWGGTIDDLHQTIRFGIRSGHDEARIGDMPAFGRDGILDKDQVDQVASYVATLAGIEPEAGVDVAAGQTVFAENCAACHGDDGKGLQELGAPDLTAPNYLYGKSLEAIKAQVTNARNGVMPNWEGRLDPATVKSLAVYVHSLGGGQ